MTWISVAVFNGLIAVCYFVICFVIWRGLHVTDQMWSNRLATATGAIFFTCAVHHGAHTLHLLGPEFGFQVQNGLRMRGVFHWQMAAWDLVGAIVAVYYLTLRRSYAKLLDAPVLLFSATPLDSAERRLALLSDAADDRLLVLLGPEGDIYDWPTAATHLTGILQEEAVGRPGAGVLGPFGPVILDPLNRTQAELHVGDGDLERWLEATSSPVHDGDQFLGWGIVLRDITARRRDEIALQAAHGMLASVLDAATGTAVIATDLEGVITVFNSGAEQMLGYTGDELIGRRTLAVLHDPFEIAAATTGREREVEWLARAARSGGAGSRDWTYVRRDGTRLLASVTLTTTHGANGEAEGFLAVAVDVTTGRRDERLLRGHAEVAEALASEQDPDVALQRAFAALAHAGDWQVAHLWSAGEDGTLGHRASWSSEQHSRFLAGSEPALAPGEGFAGRAFADGRPVWTDGARGAAGSPGGSAGETEGLRALIAVPVGGRDALVGVLEVACVEQRTPASEEVAALEATGSLIGLHLERQRALEEITAQAAELRQTSQELERSNADLGHFASVASHDLQEPLRKIQTFGDQLQRRCSADLDERGRMYVERMQAAATRMRTLIEDLLSFSRVTSAARPFVEVDLAALAAEVLDDISQAIDESGAAVCVGPLPIVDADRTQMRQLLQNLIANAIKFRREGVEHHVDVAAERENGHLRLSVADNGIGFDEQYAERIFGIFERLHGRDEYAGTGIGLAVCQRIAERHGGNIAAAGVPDRGACFTVTLPSSLLTQGPNSGEPQARNPLATTP